eukprot:m.481510 g.481510  ORF g.481510 m.481510 type:complete len:57 (-) comp57166_c0_seq1:209-379(-)
MVKRPIPPLTLNVSQCRQIFSPSTARCIAWQPCHTLPTPLVLARPTTAAQLPLTIH